MHDRLHLQAPAARDYRLAAGVYLLAWVVLSWPWLSGAVTIPYDAKALFQAQLQFLANALHSGQSPFWNPSSFVGMPQIADPQSLIFSPAIILAYFERIPSFRELDVYVLSMLALGGLAILKFCQDKGWHPAGAAVAAIAFAFGSSAAWRIQHISQIESLAFFAIALWLLERALDRSSPVYGVLTGLAVGAMIVEPDQVALLACYVLAAHVLGHWLLSRDRTRALKASLKPLACAVLVSVAIAAVPLLVTYLFLEASNRPDMAFNEAARGSLHPASLLTGVVADLFGVLDPSVEYWGPYSATWNPNELTLSYNMSQMYLGTLPIILILAAGLGRGLLWAREIRVLAISAACLILYALGAYTPAFSLFYDYFPGVAFFRRPVDATFIVGALLAISAGYLVHRWATASLPRGVVSEAVPRGRLARIDFDRCNARGLQRRESVAGLEAHSRGVCLDLCVLAGAGHAAAAVATRRTPGRDGAGGLAGDGLGSEQRDKRSDRPAAVALRGAVAGLQQRDDPLLEDEAQARAGLHLARSGRIGRSRLRVAECWPRARLRGNARLQSVPTRRGL